MDEAQCLADRIGILRAGELVAIGTMDEIATGLRADAIVRFRVPDGVASDALAAEAGAPVEVVGDLATIRTSDPQPVLYRLTTWADSERLPLAGLEVSRPTLEDIFLELTAEEVHRG